jgi:hypothetical protein
MQQSCGRPPRHSRITVGRTGDHTFEQSEHATHRGLSIKGGDKMHLRGAGVGEADIDIVGEKYVAQQVSTVHACSPEFLMIMLRSASIAQSPPDSIADSRSMLQNQRTTRERERSICFLH